MSVRFWLSVVLSSTLAASALADPPAKIPAQAPAAPLQITCEFIEVSATKGKTASIDPKLAPLEKKLKKPPFSSQWTEFKQLSQASKKIEKEKPETIALSRGTVGVTLHEIVDKSKARMTIKVINAKGAKVLEQTSVVEGGDYIIHTVLLPNDDGHLVAVTCK
jgi:hypothetical protein